MGTAAAGVGVRGNKKSLCDTKEGQERGIKTIRCAAPDTKTIHGVVTGHAPSLRRIF